MPQRRHPTHGVLGHATQATIVFLTVCTKNRSPWLANPEIHTTLVEVWKKADAWRIGRYVLMPDHLHLFASPANESIALDNWVTFWKSQFSKRHGAPSHRWQTDHWDRRLRSEDSYDEKWHYVRNNPVRAGLASNTEDWPYQGELNALRWD